MKKVLKQFSSAVVGAVLLLSGAAPAAIALEAPVGAWYPPERPGEFEQAFGVMDGETSDYVPSHVMVTDSTGNQHLCDDNEDSFGASADVLGRPLGAGETVDEFPCSKEALLHPDAYVSGRVLLEPCSAGSPEENFCIESLSFGFVGETMQQGSFDRVVAGPTIARTSPPSTVGLGKFRGGTVSLWESPVAHSRGESMFAANVAVLVEAEYEYDSEGNKTNYLGLKYSGLSASVTPYFPVDTSSDMSFGLTDLTIYEDYVPSVGPRAVWSGGDGPRCAFAEENLCGRIVDYPEGMKVGMSLRVPDELGGLFKGRLKAPEITTTPLAAGFQRITVEGAAIRVPRLEKIISATVLRDALDDVVYQISEQQTLTVADLELVFLDGAGKPIGAMGSATPASSPGSFDIITWLKDYANDTVSGFNTMWSFGTLGEQMLEPGSEAEICLADTTRVLGVITSNALAYQDTPPTLSIDESGNTSLSYQVAGLHFETDGVTPVLGTYDLVLASDVARCLYGSDSLPIGELTAEVTITESAQTLDASTTPKSRTLVVSEADGWFKLSASNFTFSTNDINVVFKRKTGEQVVGDAGPVVIPVVSTPPVPSAVPAIVAGKTGAVLIGGVATDVTIGPNSESKALEIKGTDWSLALSSGTNTPALNSEGELVLNPEVKPQISGNGFQASSKASAYLLPAGSSQVAALGITSAKLRALTQTAIFLGEIAVDVKGAFSTSLDLSKATAGDYILQINGAAPDGKIRSISLKATIPNVALKGWTKKLTGAQAKAYVKNIVGKGKVQILLNGKEVAWVNAADTTDPKLKNSAGSSYLVRTLNLQPGKNRVEILVDGKRERLTTYTVR